MPPLLLTFSCGQRETLDIMNAFVKSLYDWNYTGIVNQNKMKKMMGRMLVMKI